MAKADLTKKELSIQEKNDKIKRDREKALALLNRAKAAEKQIKAERDKVRNHKLIQRGALVEIAGLVDVNPQVTMGALLEVTQMIANHDEVKIQEWHREGAKLLAISKTDRKTIKEDNIRKVTECKEINPALSANEDVLKLDVT